jgi:hypothetical protein
MYSARNYNGSTGSAFLQPEFLFSLYIFVSDEIKVIRFKVKTKRWGLTKRL